jgi:hypothetical protein
MREVGGWIKVDTTLCEKIGMVQDPCLALLLRRPRMPQLPVHDDTEIVCHLGPWPDVQHLSQLLALKTWWVKWDNGMLQKQREQM